MKKIIAKNKKHLEKLIQEEMEKNGPNCDLNHIDVTKITDMSWLFCDSQFNGYISEWDVSKVNCMYCMFYNSKFNQDISKWNVGMVIYMHGIFNSMGF